MNITEVKIRRIFPDDGTTKMRALVSITIDDCLAIHDIKVIENNGRFFLAMPSRKVENTTYNEKSFADIVHPINAEVRKEMEETVLSMYFSVVENMEEEGEI